MSGCQGEDLILSQCLEWGSLAKRLGEVTNRTLDILTRVNLVTSDISQEATKLATHLCQHQTTNLEGLQGLSMDLLRISREHNRILLTTQCKSGEGWTAPREQQIKDALAPTTISFFDKVCIFYRLCNSLERTSPGCF